MKSLKQTLRQYRILFVLILLVILVSSLSDVFFTWKNIMIVIRQISMVAIIAAGMTVVIITAGIDLSVGSIAALAGAVGAGFMTGTDSLLVGILVTLGVGILAGLFNGILITTQNLPPFIVTLATMVGISGLTKVYTQGNPIIANTEGFRFIGRGDIFGISVPIIIMFVVYLLVYILLSRTKFGRHVYAVGGNEEAARLTGIPCERVKVIVYTMNGFLAALAGLVLTSRLASAGPNAGSGWELDAIAAVILGGTSLMGGSGWVVGSLFGALILGIISNALNLMNISPFYQDVVKACIIIIAVIVDSRLSQISEKSK